MWFSVRNINVRITMLDCPENWQMSFSESASPAMEGIVSFNNHICVVLCFILVFVGWNLANAVYYYSSFYVSKATTFTHCKESLQINTKWTSRIIIGYYEI